MKQHIYIIVFIILLSAGFSRMYAQHYWAMAVLEKGKESPTILEYHCHNVAETAENGTEYYRIYDYSFLFRNEQYNPVKLQYGYRLADKQIFVYDFESQEETLAFDFNLAVGEQFTTYNGIEWIVEAAKDTLVNTSFCGKGESVTKKLLTVRSLDGTLRDQWLEDFGSFTNHFMINSMDNVVFSQTLWMEYDYGEYLAREICEGPGPIYGHDSGWLDADYGSNGSTTRPYTSCTYSNGQLTIEDFKKWFEHRHYVCFYRDGDKIQQVYSWELKPHVDSGNSALRRDVITFNGLPEPESGKYTIILGDNVYTTGVSSISSVRTDSQKSGYTYDLQGRRVDSKNAVQGIYIKDGKKVIVK